MKNRENLEKVLGSFIIEFGDLETNIRILLISIPKVYESNHENKFIQLILKVLLQNDSVSINLKILKEIVEIFVAKKHQDNWLKFIDRLKQIAEFRNTLVHGMWYNDLESMQFHKYKKFDFDNAINIPVDKLVVYTNELQNFNRQIFDLNMYNLSKEDSKFIYFEEIAPKIKLRITEDDKI